jgi:hypothetical protein
VPHNVYCLNKNVGSIYGLSDALKEGRINYIVSVSVQIFRVGLAVYAFVVKLLTTKPTFLVFLILLLRGGFQMITLRQEVIREVNMPLACAVAGACR